MDKTKLKFEEVVAEMLLKMGITPNLSGYHYIIDCTYVIVKKHCRITEVYKYSILLWNPHQSKSTLIFYIWIE